MSSSSAKVIQIDLLRGSQMIQIGLYRDAEKDRDYVFHRQISQTRRERHYTVERLRVIAGQAPSLGSFIREWERQNFAVANAYQVDISQPEIDLFRSGSLKPPSSLTTRIRNRRISNFGSDDFNPSSIGIIALDELKDLTWWIKMGLNNSGSIKPSVVSAARVVPPAPFVDPNLVKPGDKIIIPSTGEPYLARLLEGNLSDVQMLRNARVAKLYALFRSLPGTGKSMAVIAAFGDDLRTIQCTGDTQVADFVGDWMPTDTPGKYNWVDGPLIEAMTLGIPLFVDEIALGDPLVLSVLLSAIDGRREVRVSANPARGVVKAAEGFYVVAAYNPDVPGARISEAVLSRFPIKVEYSTDFDTMKKLGVPTKLVNACIKLDRKRKEGEIGSSPQAREMLGFVKTSKIFGEAFALRALVQDAADSDRDVLVEILNRDFATSITPLATH
jgi:nitric oxide reductase NorQ protein